MALQPVVDTIDSVPEPLRTAYVERDGKFHLDVEGLVPKAKLDEFRETNIARSRELDALRQRYDGVDPDKFREYETRAAKERDKRLIDAGKMDELIEARVGAMRTDHKMALDGIASENKTLKQRLESLLVDGALRDAAAKAGVRPGAVDDVLLRGRMVFRVEGDKAIAYDGDKAMYGKSGDPVSVSEWIEGLSQKAAHLFEPSNGSGARGSGNAATGKDTITRAEFEALPHHERGPALKTKKLID